MMGLGPPVIVVGSGFGCRIQVPALRAAGFDVVALVGTDRPRTASRAQANGVPNAFVDLDEAIAKTGAVAVAIATPPHTHAPLALMAIARGCHVICEKPFASNAGEARSMLKAATRAGVVHMLGYEFRWSPERAMLGRVIEQGLVGEPKLATFTSLIPYLVNPDVDVPGWWFDPASGGGWLGAAGSHLVDWIRLLLGEFDSLSASTSNIVSDPAGAEDTFAFRFRMKSGAEGVVQQTAAAWGEPVDVVRVAGTKGSVWLDGGKVRLANGPDARTVPPSADLALAPLPPVSTDPRQQTAKWQMLTNVELPAYVRLCQAFHTLIEGREPPQSVRIPTFADGVASMEVLDAIRTSAAAGGALTTVRSAIEEIGVAAPSSP